MQLNPGGAVSHAVCMRRPRSTPSGACEAPQVELPLEAEAGSDDASLAQRVALPLTHLPHPPNSAVGTAWVDYPGLEPLAGTHVGT